MQSSVPRYLAVVIAAATLAVAGCTTDDRRIEVAGQSRSYQLYVPTNYGANAPSGEGMVPLVLALHPFLGTAGMMADMTGLNALAEREGFIVAYPNGRRWSWNSDGRGAADDIGFLDQMIDHVTRDYRIDPARIFATGASAGGMMTQRFACVSKRLAAIAPVMSNVQSLTAETCGQGSPLPVMIIHGRQDPIVPYGGGAVKGRPGEPMRFLSAPETAAFWAKRNGCTDTQPLEEPLADTGGRVQRRHFACPEGAPVTLYSLDGGGHTWPGRENLAPRFIVGPTSMDIDATALIWEFFKGHSRPAS